MTTDRRVASRLAHFGESVFTPFTRYAREYGAVNLGQGFPNFDGPDEVKEAAIQAIRDGQNQYAPVGGVPALQEAIAAWTADDGGPAIDPTHEVTVTAGCTEALPAVMLGLLEPGDEVITFEPFYDAYPAAIEMAGGVMCPVPMPPPAFSFDVDAVAAAITPRTRAILVNTPHNPTGTVLDADAADALAALCVQHDLLCITDEVYERLVFDDVHRRLRAWPGMAERTITLSSLGKTFSFTGWKIGWAVAPPPLTEAIRAAHQFLTFSVATPLQHAAAAALRLPSTYLESFVADYRARRDVLVDGLRRIGFDVRPPAGTYFVLADHRPFGFSDDWSFCEHLVKEVGVVAIPPSAFYRTPGGGRDHARFAFCKDLDSLRAGVDRLEAGLRRA